MIEVKRIYIFPGFEETIKRKPYQKLKNILQEKGYEVFLKNINWKEKLSKQIFKIEDNSILFGFSLGAVFAKLLAENNNPSKVLLASMTEMKYFKNKNNIKELAQVCGRDFVFDIKDNLKKKKRQKNEIYFYGELEGGDGDVIVKGAEHELSDRYIQEIINKI